MCAKSTLRLALAAAAAQDIVGFTVFALDLLDVDDGDDDDDANDEDDALPLVSLLAIDIVVALLVFGVLKADATIRDEADEVQCTGGFGRAVGAGAS